MKIQKTIMLWLPRAAMTSRPLSCTANATCGGDQHSLSNLPSAPSPFPLPWVVGSHIFFPYPDVDGCPFMAESLWRLVRGAQCRLTL